MGWEKVLDAICIVMDPEEPIVKLEGSVIEDALGMVVKVQSPEQDISPGPGYADEMERYPYMFIVFVPSLLWVTVSVPDAITKDELELMDIAL